MIADAGRAGTSDLPVVVIPAFEATNALVSLVEALHRNPFRDVIVVDDGSTPGCRGVFADVESVPGVHVLRHAENLGKGQALKSAFSYYLMTWPESHVGVVTADADGQHLAGDIERVSATLSERRDALVLGARRLIEPIPWKSSVGNRVTKHVFNGLFGQALSDTQTGLRGIPRGFARDLLRVPASRYEFEMEMLVEAVVRRRPLVEVPIETVYKDGNRGSHFNPLLDSLRIYFVFLRFVLLSLTTALLDFTVFAVTYGATANILEGTVAARIVAGIFNFYFARRVVFKAAANPARQAVGYVTLVALLMMTSYAILTWLVSSLGLTVYVAKVVAETTLFLASFAAQRLLIFRAKPTP